MRRQLVADQVFGQFFRGDGIPSRGPTFSARVERPFVLEVTCSVPTGLHATILQNRYVVLPGSMRRQELRPVTLLQAAGRGRHWYATGPIPRPFP